MRKLSAHYIFPSYGPPLKYGIIKLHDDGEIIEIIDTGGRLKEESNLEFYPGILSPGFINAHCHLELSHMLKIIPEKTGITSFIDQVSKNRYSDEDKILNAVKTNSEELFRTGTSAIADIVNTDITIESKKKSSVYSHSFVELFGTNPDGAEAIWENGLSLEAKFKASGLSASISPHAPYSLSKKLWSYFKKYPPVSLSIHNQESLEEEDLMILRKGRMAEWFISRGLDLDNLPSPKNSSLESIINELPKKSQLLLVHNTFSSIEDIKLVDNHFGLSKVFWVICPNANLHIENNLPDIVIDNKDSLQICLGTDSLASNSKLSILEEMKTLQFNFPVLRLEELINWSTISGARALGIQDKYGSFETGKCPGVVWLSNIDLKGLKLSPDSKSLRLV